MRQRPLRGFDVPGKVDVGNLGNAQAFELPRQPRHQDIPPAEHDVGRLDGECVDTDRRAEHPTRESDKPSPGKGRRGTPAHTSDTEIGQRAQ